MKSIVALRALGVAPALACAAGFGVLLEGALLSAQPALGSPLLYGTAAALVVVAGWTHVGETRLQQLKSNDAQRARAGEETYGMLSVMVPTMFVLTQLLLLGVVFTMTERIGRVVSLTFFGAILGLVLLSAIAASQHKRLSAFARVAAAWARK